MENVIGNLISVLLQGGPEVVAVLLLFIVLILLDRKRMLAEIAKKDARNEKIIEDYHTGSMTLADALNSLKIVLYELRSKV